MCFSAAVADYLLYGNITSNPCIDDIYDPEVKEKMKKVATYIAKIKINILYQEYIKYIASTVGCTNVYI